MKSYTLVHFKCMLQYLDPTQGALSRCSPSSSPFFRPGIQPGRKQLPALCCLWSVWVWLKHEGDSLGLRLRGRRWAWGGVGIKGCVSLEERGSL